MKKIAFLGFSKKDIPSKTLERFGTIAQTVVFAKDEDDIGGSEALLVRIFEKIDKELMDTMDTLKYISTLATDFSYIDIAHARSKSIAVANLGGYSTEAVAEFVIAAILENTRHLSESRKLGEAKDYGLAPFFGVELKGKTLGVIGAGRIGARIVELFSGFNMNLTYHSRTEKAELTNIGAKNLGLQELLQNSDFIILSLALNKDTEEILNEKMITSIKKGAVFINIAPNKLINQHALLDRLERDELTFIFDHAEDMQGDIKKRHEKSPRSIIYPPVAFRTNESETARWEILASNLENFIKGSPTNVVN